MSIHPYLAFIHRVEKPARYLGGEYMSVHKNWETTPIKIALAFPDVYEIGASHLGMKILYSILNKQDDILAERVCAPWFDLEKELRERQLPLLTLESHQPLQAFDVVGFSLQYEMTYTNILTMLDLGGIPLRSSDRHLSHPLVVAGGPCATNPEPMADFIDVFVIGDGEEVFSRLSRLYTEMRKNGADKTEILIALAQLGGVYCPALYDVKTDEITGLEFVSGARYDGVPAIVKRTTVSDINDYPFPSDSPVPLTQVVFDRTAVEIARGCTEGCRFCQAGMIYRPVRERSPEQIIDAVMDSVKKAGYDESGLTSLSTADFSCVSPLVKELMKRLKKEKVSLSVSSLRAYGLSGDLLDEISDIRNTSLTFAPEAGTQRMRDVINKNISEEDITQSAHNVFSRGWRKMKLYFMIGLPTETDEDVRGICETGQRLYEVAKVYHKRWKSVSVVVSVSSFVPKPHTPFQWCQMISLEDINRKQAILKQLSRQYHLGLKWHHPEVSYIEGVMSRGDRKLGRVIEKAWRKGSRFDSWGSYLQLDHWLESLEECGIDPNIYHRTLPLDAHLPWEHIDVGLAPGFLAKEYKRALKDRLSPPCGKPFRAKVHHTNLEDAKADQRLLICYDCGVACDLTQMKEERFEFLKQLGAEKRGEPVPEPIPGQLRLPPKEKFPFQGTSYTYRATFTKLGLSAYTAHSDLIRILPRVIRRAGFKMTYSQGFHPKPIMAFGPALSLGVPSFGEMMDFQLTEAPSAQTVLTQLNAVCPEGVRFTQVEKLEPGSRSLSKILTHAFYLVGIHGDQLSALMDTEEIVEMLDRRIETLLQTDKLIVKRVRKDREREVDIRPMLYTLEQTSERELHSYLAELDWESLVYLTMKIQIAGQDSLKPEEVLKALFGHDDFPYQTARLFLGEPEISRHRVLEPLLVGLHS